MAWPWATRRWNWLIAARFEVYRKALDFIGDASARVALWDKRHAVADQFGRASDSLILNLAEGARLRPGRAKLRAFDFALGSCLECAAIAEGNGRYSEVDHHHFLDLAAAAAVKVAAGLDLATRKGSWDRTACEPGKALLERIMSMLSRM